MSVASNRNRGFVDRLGEWLNRLRQGRTAQQPGLSRIVEPFPIEEDDPLLAYLERAGAAVNISDITLPESESPALQTARSLGIHLLVPLISQGELVAVLSLGEQMSERDYSREDRNLLNMLATQAAPAFVVGELVREREEAARLRERDEQEMRIAHQIQLALLPKVLPQIRHWSLSPSYIPARAVRGDFYDYIDLPDHKLGIFIGDVSSKGVPAALLMATTRSILRGIARRHTSPSSVLERANEALVQEMPHGMFVTCFYAVIDWSTGEFTFANAGHLMPFHQRDRDHDHDHDRGQNVIELKARGMPLGLMPNMVYEQVTTYIKPLDNIVFYSDGLIEAHNAAGEMFGWQRALATVANAPGKTDLNQRLLDALHDFVGPDWEQEDDITLLTLACELGRADGAAEGDGDAHEAMPTAAPSSRILLDTEIASALGNERLAMQKVEAAIEPLALPSALRARIGTAVAEATMNAMEHGNQYQADKSTHLRVLLNEATSEPRRLRIQITDHGTSTLPEPPAPNLDAKLAGLQSPRGWGLFLIRNMADDVLHSTDPGEPAHHMIELIFYLPEGATTL